jgi:hypothetical protein
MFPWDGPGSAPFNPAAIAETGMFDVMLGNFSAVSGKGSVQAFQGSVRVLDGFYAGLEWASAGSAVDGSNAVYQESALKPMLAFGWRDFAGPGYSLDIGGAYSIQTYSAFGAIETDTKSLDLGAHLLWPEMPHGLGRIHNNLTFNNLYNNGVRLPADKGGRYYPDWHGDASLFWSGIWNRVDVFNSFAFYESPDPDEGGPPDRLHWKSAGIEVRPIPAVGLKLERTWMGYWMAGTVVHTAFDGVRLGGELDLSHDALAPDDDGRGYLWSFALNVGA